MEKRFYWGIFLLLILLISSFFLSNFLYNTHMPTSLLLEKDFSKSAISKAYENWKENWKLTAVLVDHTPGENIEALFYKLDSLTDPSFIKSTCRELSVQLKALAESQLLRWWNLF